MRNEIAFGSTRERQPKLLYPFHRLCAGERVVGTILSPSFTVITYHWLDGKDPVVHTFPHCICQSGPVPFRERAYLALARAHNTPQKGLHQVLEVLEVPESLRSALEVLADERRSLRGLRIEAKRKSGKKNGPVEVLQWRWEDTAQLEGDLDVRTFVEQLWSRYRLDVTPRARQCASPADDGPDAEIPCGE